MTEEATERVITYITPEILKPKSSVGKNSIGKMTTRASPSFPEEAMPVPNYLRTSSSSCHDFCKYGKKQDLEVKKRRPIHHRLTSNKETILDGKDQVTVVTQPERRKNDNVKLVASQDKGHGTKKPAANRQNDLPPVKIIQVSDLPPEKIIQASDLPPEKIIQVSDLSPEKIIQLTDSPANLAEGSAQTFSDMNFDIASIVETPALVFGHAPANQDDRSSEESTSIEQLTPATISTRNESDEHISTEPSELLSENPSSKFDQKAMESSDDYGEFAPRGGLSAEPVTVNLMVSSSVQHNCASALHTTANQPERISEESVRVELTSAFLVKDNTTSTAPIVSSLLDAQHVKASSTKAKNDKNVNRKKLACSSEECTEEDSSIKRESTLPPASGTGSSVHQLEGSAKIEGKKFIGPTIDAKTKRDMSKLEGKVIGVYERPKVIRKAKADTSPESNRKQKTTPTARKSVPSTKTETKRKISNSITLVTPIAKNKASSAGGLAQKNHEKTIKFSRSLDRGAEKSLEKSLKSLSMQSHSSSVPTAKLQVQSKLSPVSQGKILTRAGKLRLKNGRSDSTDAKSEKINSKTSRKQKSPLSGEKDGNSGSKFEADKSTLRQEVTRRISGVVLKSEINRQPRRTASVHSEDKISTAHKLKFSRGKVVSLHPDTNVLKILRFRRAKMEDRSVKGDLDTKEYSNRSGRTGEDSKSPIPKAPTVVLRHQDVQEKKDTQGLLNQVIEETASRLVETRKSKVKALVGAFETVISLHESKVAPVPVPGTDPVA